MDIPFVERFSGLHWTPCQEVQMQEWVGLMCCVLSVSKTLYSHSASLYAPWGIQINGYWIKNKNKNHFSTWVLPVFYWFFFCYILFISSKKNYLYIQKLFEVEKNMINTKGNDTLYLRVQFTGRYLS